MRALSAVFAGLLAVTAACRGEKRSREEDPAVGKPGNPVVEAVAPLPPLRFELEISVPGLAVSAVEAEVARPIEQALAGIDGVREIRSSSRAGLLIARCILAPGVDAGQAARAALVALGPVLPPAAGPPVVRQLPPDARRFTLVLSADTLSRADVASVFEQRVRPALERARGVRQVTACGSASAIVAIRVDADRLAASAITLADIEPAIAGAKTIDDLAASPLPGPRPIALRDLAQVERTLATPACRAATPAGQVLSIEIVAGTDAATASAIADAVAGLGRELPAGAVLRVLEGARDQTPVEIWFDVPVTAAEGTHRAVVDALGSVVDAGDLVVEQRDATAVVADHPVLRAIVLTRDRAGLLAAAAKLPFRSRAPVGEARFRIRGEDFLTLRTAADRAIQQLSGGSEAIAAAGIAEPEPTMLPEIELVVDRDRAGQAGVAPADIARVFELATTPGGKPIGRLGDGTPVHLSVAGADPVGRTPSLEHVFRLTVRARDGAVPLSSVVTIEQGEAPSSILRIDRQRAIELWIAPRPGTTAGAALAAAKARLAAHELPAAVTLDWGREVEPASKL